MNHLVIAPVVVPLLAGILLLLLREENILIKRTLSLVSLFAQLGLALLIMQTCNTGNIDVYAVGNWAPPFGIVLVADRLAAFMLVITALLSIFAFLYAMLGTDKAGRHFHTLFQLQMFGLNGAFLTGDLFNLFVFFEILLLASYGLLLHGGGRLRTKAGLHFVVINLAGSTLFLFAVGTLYGILGTLNMADLALKVAATPPENLPLVRAAGLLLFGVFALKAALLPLHLWLPAAYAHTSAPVAALFAIMTKVGAYCILRVYTLIFGDQAGPAANLIEAWLLPLALTTLALGTLGVVGSKHLRIQTAYLIVASIGTLLTAFALNTTSGIAAGLYYLPHTTFAAAAMFLLAETIAARRGRTDDLLEPGPAIASARLLGGLFVMAAILLSGLPPLSGFLGKFMLLGAALGHPALPWIMAIVLMSGLLLIIALARDGNILFYKARSSDAPATAFATTSFPELAPILGLLALGLALTIWAGHVLSFAEATARQLLQPSLYIQAVIGGGG